jgi:hypothetical protein
MNGFLHLPCPKCRADVAISMNQAGDVLTCGKCGARFKIRKRAADDAVQPAIPETPRRMINNRVVRWAGIAAAVVLCAGVALGIVRSRTRGETLSASTFFDRPLSYWSGLGAAWGMKQTNDPGDDYYIGSIGDGLFLRVVFTRGRLTEVFIARTDVAGDAGAEAVLAAWGEVDADTATRMRELRGGHPGDTRLRWLRDTEYAVGWGETNKGYVRWIGPQSRYPRLVAMEAEVAELVLQWVDVLDRSERKLEAAKGGVGDYARAALPEFLNLAAAFGDVEPLEPYGAIRGRSGGASLPDRSLWADWPCAAKMRLMSAAGRCRSTCLRAERELRERKVLLFRPYSLMRVAIYEECTKAMRELYGDYRLMEGYRSEEGMTASLSARMGELQAKAILIASQDEAY